MLDLLVAQELVLFERKYTELHASMLFGQTVRQDLNKVGYLDVLNLRRKIDLNKVNRAELQPILALFREFFLRDRLDSVQLKQFEAIVARRAMEFVRLNQKYDLIREQWRARLGLSLDLQILPTDTPAMTDPSEFTSDLQRMMDRSEKLLLSERESVMDEMIDVVNNERKRITAIDARFPEADRKFKRQTESINSLNMQLNSPLLSRIVDPVLKRHRVALDQAWGANLENLNSTLVELEQQILKGKQLAQRLTKNEIELFFEKPRNDDGLNEDGLNEDARARVEEFRIMQVSCFSNLREMVRTRRLIENRLQLQELDFASQLLDARNAVDNRKLKRKIAEELLTEIKAIAPDHASIHRLSLFDRTYFQLSTGYLEMLNSSFVSLELARNLCLISQDHVEVAVYELEQPVGPGSGARLGMDTAKTVAESFDGLHDSLLALEHEWLRFKVTQLLLQQ